MMKNLQKSNQVSVCHKNSCVHAAGENAKMITMGATLMLVLIGIAVLLKSA
ncbi:hypothetical protein [Brumimicrobium salinarum]|uniref:hypothetical protein n=1 Tax=Brumimicrobium salinarum TaxID=2058658 RepID=UPI0013FDC2F7|nr:hypothetical protein [Brumimicrobium salinarum]